MGKVEHERLPIRISFCSSPNVPLHKVKRVLKKILDPVHTMQLCFGLSLDTSIGTGCSTLITGPVGVGKSSIMIVAYVLLCLLTDHVLPVYHEYSDAAPWLMPLDMLRDTSLLRLPHLVLASNEAEQILFTLQEKQLMTVFFADEIQRLYVPQPDPRQQAVVKQLALIGKSSFNIGVVSGSSIATEARALRPVENGFVGYQTLNHSVYLQWRMDALRLKEEFFKLVESRSGRKPTEEQLRTLFLHTGASAAFWRCTYVVSTVLIHCLIHGRSARRRTTLTLLFILS
eukprot:GILJ01005464.1.p1 GENE.GILJ01005464.1~~GILJ01005464.1.p1  ORF type:complete len:286 (-),score=9.95 GILJ01005464.1:1443-2300(-)